MKTLSVCFLHTSRLTWQCFKTNGVYPFHELGVDISQKGEPAECYYIRRAGFDDIDSLWVRMEDPRTLEGNKLS